MITVSLPFSLFTLAAEGRESVSDSGILVSKSVDLTIDEVTLKPAGIALLNRFVIEVEHK